MKAAVLALLCLIFVVRAADNNTHVPDSTHHSGADYMCTAKKLNATDKAKILATINGIRSATAGGTNGQFPKAANMKQIRWDDLLEAEANDWAANCTTLNSPHSRRRANRTHTIKELLYVASNCHEYTEATWERAFNDWHAGNKSTPISLVDNYTYSASRPDVQRSFTLLNWANTDIIGCGFSNLESLDPVPVHKQFIVCHFAEGGNKLNEKVYITGEPASKCPTNFSKSATYPNLCDATTVIPIPTNPNEHTTTGDNGTDTFVKNCTGYAMGETEKQLLVTALNKERSQIAMGNYLTSKDANVRPNGFPKAGNMRELVWDDNLAKTALNSSSYCAASTADLKAKLNVAEILFAQSSKNPFPNVAQWTTAAAYWVSRKTAVREAWLKSFDFGTSVADKEAAVYTQVIWANSYEVGCAFANYEETWTSKIDKKISVQKYIQWIICHFQNPGDIKGQTVYIPAEPCDKCGEGWYCTSRDEGLCTQTPSG